MYWAAVAADSSPVRGSCSHDARSTDGDRLLDITSHLAIVAPSSRVRWLRQLVKQRYMLGVAGCSIGPDDGGVESCRLAGCCATPAATSVSATEGHVLQTT